MSKAGETQIPGLNVQWPWSELIANGKKSVETRGYNIPAKYLGKPLALIETPGPAGKKSAGITKAQITAIITIGRTYRYTSYDQWAKESHLHCVPSDDPKYRYKKGKPRWAWAVVDVKKLSSPLPAPKRRGIIFAIACTVTL